MRRLGLGAHCQDAEVEQARPTHRGSRVRGEQVNEEEAKEDVDGQAIQNACVLLKDLISRVLRIMGATITPQLNPRSTPSPRKKLKTEG